MGHRGRGFLKTSSTRYRGLVCLEVPSYPMPRSAEPSDLAQRLHTRGDLSIGEADDALGAELLDVERSQGGAVGHRRAQQLVRDALVVQVGGDVADEPTGERVARTGRVDDTLQGIGGEREEVLARDQRGAVLALLGDDYARLAGRPGG